MRRAGAGDVAPDRDVQVVVRVGGVEDGVEKERDELQLRRRVLLIPIREAVVEFDEDRTRRHDPETAY